MLSTNPAGGGSITLDQWIALNDEMVALVRAGMPLDRGLVEAGRDMRGTAGGLATRLGERLAAGKSLDQALDDEGGRLPGLYRAVVLAGVRSGRLAQALESMATFARGVAETRRAIGLASFYPILVILVAYALFMVFVLFVLPAFLSTFETFRIHEPRPIRWLAALGETVNYWGLVFPIAMIVLGLLWVQSNRASRLRPGRLSGLLRWIPGLSSILANAQAANVAEVLSLLVSQGIPLPQALPLAADASGDPGVRRAALEMAGEVERGEALSSSVASHSEAFPPLLRWVLSTGDRHPDLASALRHVGQTYRQRASQQAESVQAILPALMLISLGAITVLVYALTIFGPMALLWYDLATPGAGEN